MSSHQIIEQKLGRSLDAARRASIDHLNQVPKELVDDARRLGAPGLARELIDYYTSAACHRSTRGFVQDVVFGGVSPRTWRRGRVLVPAVSLETQLRSEPRVLLAPLAGEPQARVVPDLDSWRSGVSWVGAPAFIDPDSDYRSPEVDNFASLRADAATEAMADPAVALRRWIAGRLARCLQGLERLDCARTTSDLAVSGPSFDDWSEDAKLAGRGLLRELSELGRSEDEIPGFRGPDDWYRANSG